MKHRKLIALILFLLQVLLFDKPNPIQATEITLDYTDILEDIVVKDVCLATYTSYIKFNISSFAGKMIMSAKLQLYTQTNPGDNDIRVWNIANQTWTEAETGINLFNMAKSSAYEDTAGLQDNQYNDIEVTDLLQIAVDAGYTNGTIRFDDPDDVMESLTDACDGTTESSSLFWGASGATEVAYASDNHGFDNRKPKLFVSYRDRLDFEVDYDFPTATDMQSSVVPVKVWNDTQLLYRIWMFPYEDSTNVSIYNIPTNYQFIAIHPNCSDFSDTISSNRQITFIDLYEGTYEVLLDPQEDWHTLHISLYGPDGVGLLWESFVIEINNTRIPYPPSYRIEIGYYEYEIQDYFSQTVLSGNFTIAASDPEDVYQNWEVPLYKVAFLNKDIVPYNVNITRNAITRVWPSDSTDIRLYGLASGIPYTIVIINVNSGEIRDQYTLHMSNDPAQRLLDYEPDDPTPGGVAKITKLLEPRDFILPAFFLLGGFFLLSTFMSRRSKKQQSRKDWREAYLAHKGVSHSSQLSHYDRRKMREAEEHRFGKSRFRRKQA